MAFTANAIGRNFAAYQEFVVTADGSRRNFTPPAQSFWAERPNDIIVTVQPPGSPAPTPVIYTYRTSGEAATATTYTSVLAAPFGTPNVMLDNPPANGASVRVELSQQAVMREDITGVVYSPVTATTLMLRAFLAAAVAARTGASSGGGGGGSSEAFEQVALQTDGDLRFTRGTGQTVDVNLPTIVQNTNPYHYFEQHKDIAINIPQGDQARIEATGDGYDIPFMAKTTHAQAVMAGRNFVTDPEGFINLHFSGAGVVRADISFKTTHHFSEVDSSVPDLTTSSRTEQQEVVLGEANSVNLRAHGSNVVVTPQSTGGSLAGRSVPISIVVNVKVFNNTGARVPGNVWGSGNKAGITFWQLADNSGATGPAGAAGANADVSIGTVTTGAAGSQAQVTNTGSGASAILNFVIPRGADGTGGGGGVPADNSIRVAKLNFQTGALLTEGRAITIGTGGEFATAALPTAAQLLPTTGSAGGRALVDVYSNGQITPTWRARIIGFAGGSGDNTAGFQAGDILRVPVGGGNAPNYYLVDSGRAPGESLAAMIAAQGVSLISPRDLTNAIGKNNLAFASGTDEGAGRLIVLRADNQFGTIAVPSGGGGISTVNSDTTLTGDGSAQSPLGVANPFTADDETKLDGIAAGATVGATAAQVTAIGLNTAKRSFPTAAETKLNSIAAGAQVNPTTAAIIAGIEAQSGNDRLNYNALKNIPTNLLTAVASNATLTGSGTTASPLAVATPATADDLVGTPSISSGNLIFSRRTGSDYTVPLPTGSAGTNVRRVLMATQQNIVTGNAGAVNTFNAGQNISLDGSENFGEWDIIYFVCGYTETRATPDQDNDYVIAVDGTLFRASTAAARYVITGSDTSTSGFTWGLYNNPDAGQTAANSNRVNISARRSSGSGGGGGDVYVKAIIGAQFRGQTGAQGAEGMAGADGAAGTITVGTVLAGAPGSTPIVTNTGTSTAATLNFTIPRGDTGATGAAGADGQDGADGAAATIAIGTVSTGSAGSNASVANSGSSSAATFNFVIPRGDRGAAGADGADGSAATIQISSATALAAGSSPTVTEVAGSTAQARNYTIGIPRGNTGAQGPAGTNGTDGQDGTSATIQVGTVTAGAPGTTPVVANAGSSSAAVFNFTIPSGLTGAQGPAGPAGQAGQAGAAATIQISEVTTLAAGSNATLTERAGSTAQARNYSLGVPRGADGTGGGSSDKLDRWETNISDLNSIDTANNNDHLWGIARNPSNLPTGVSGDIMIRQWRVTANEQYQELISLATGRKYLRVRRSAAWEQWAEVGAGSGGTPGDDSIGVAKLDFVAGANEAVGRFITIGANGEFDTAAGGGGGTTYTAGTGINITGANAIEVAEATRNAIAVNSAKVGLYAIHGTAVGVWTGVSGDPDDSTVIAAGTTQFDSTDVYLSRTDATGKAVDMSMLPAVNGAINWGGFAGTVSAISENANRIKVTITYTGGAYPIANSGHKFSLFNSADPAVSQHGVYVDNTTLEGNGDPASHLRVKANGIGVTHLDFAAGAVETVGRFLTIGAGGKITTAAGGGLATVSTDATITGDGSSGSPLAVATPATANDLINAPTINSQHIVTFPHRTGNYTLDLGSLAPGSPGTGYAEDALHVAWTPSPFNHNAHTQNLTSGKTLAGHHAFQLNFLYTHNITVGGTTVTGTKRFSQLIDGNALRGSSQSQPLVYAVPVANHTDGGYDIVLINRTSDTSFRVQFLASDAGTSAFHELTGVSSLTLNGIQYGGGSLNSIHGKAVPALPTS